MTRSPLVRHIITMEDNRAALKAKLMLKLKAIRERHSDGYLSAKEYRLASRQGISAYCRDCMNVFDTFRAKIAENHHRARQAA